MGKTSRAEMFFALHYINHCIDKMGKGDIIKSYPMVTRQKKEQLDTIEIIPDHQVKKTRFTYVGGGSTFTAGFSGSMITQACLYQYLWLEQSTKF